VGCVGAAEALRVFQSAPERFDAVISDAIMPDMPGTELLAQLRRLRPELPALLVSGYCGAELQAQAAAAGVRTILTKPLAAAELAAALAAALRARSAVPGAGPAAVAEPAREGIS
jgi:CheY-like chemotaxis protein